jgi:methenyltetrahydromethanopterin cyclohydrolase
LSLSINPVSINTSAKRLIDQHVLPELGPLRIADCSPSSAGRILDFGCGVPGGIQAGLLLARICMADLADIRVVPADRGLWEGPMLQVTTDDPTGACMAAQYAGWKVAQGKFFAMGSGPMRAKRGREEVLEHLGVHDSGDCAVGVLECDQIPSEEIVAMVAQECGVGIEQVTLCVAPTRSLAGVIQVVARSIETAMHKLHELGFDLRQVLSAHGTAPIPPMAKDFAEGIGRTNDAILYGGQVTLWVDASDEQIETIGARVPSLASKDFGKPFAKTFREYEYDFYKVDPGLFAPAMVTLVNLRTGRSFRYGKLCPEILRESFGCSAG